MCSKDRTEPLAHSRNDSGQWQPLVDHLRAVAETAQEMAAEFDAGEPAFLTGLLHDLGKFHPDFQEYLKKEEKPPGPDHKGAGAHLAQNSGLDLIAFAIAAHHGGLKDKVDVGHWLRQLDRRRTEEAIELARKRMPEITSTPPSLPRWIDSKLTCEFFVRMLFSALVDADFLDTEKHLRPDISERRKTDWSLDELRKRFEEDQSRISGRKNDTVDRVRHHVYIACKEKAKEPPGFFSLTVPTGGGKTRSSLAFALAHALQHQLRRVIYVIPYTNIIDQTTGVFRGIFGELGDNVVLEHHSAVDVEEEKAKNQKSLEWARLASENWDAPVVVTTAVQFFESLFGNKISKCRKLHNIASSVVILDEVQTLPPRLLEPILDVLRQLVAHYRTSVVLCTATQPAFDESPYLSGLPNVTEIAPEPSTLFSKLKRVQYQVPAKSEKWSWERVAEEMQSSEQALVVVNTRKQALELLDHMPTDSLFHLSTLLCGRHRRDVIEEVRRLLEEKRPCLLVSTQVVEAGVDIDFPLVLRAMGPLDSIVQAAGRCNREGKLRSGRVVIFEPEDGGLPPGAYRAATETTRQILADPRSDLDRPESFGEYFHPFGRGED